MQRNKIKIFSKLVIMFFILGVFLFSAKAQAADFQVGPGQAYTTIGSVPWYALAPGDTVYIHYAIYHEKFQVSTRGTAQNHIRVIGVPDNNGNLPIIDGQDATTSNNNHFHWQDPTQVQTSGVVFISINSDAAPMPAYIEIKNLEIKNGYTNSNFSAENGSILAYNGFAAGVNIRAAEHILIENCIIHDNGQAIYNWTGSGSDWWDGLSKDIILRGNYFYGNGVVGGYGSHQTYTEAEGVVIEYNHYGPVRAGSLGSELKDRSAGTIIRYNLFDSAPLGWFLDLVEPQNGWGALGVMDIFKQTFVFGNVIINKENHTPNYVHWNEDQTGGIGRAFVSGGKLLFYNNTILTVANQSDMGWDVPSSAFHLFNTTYGAYDCSPISPTGIIDIRNNIFAVQPRTAGQPVPIQRFAYCNDQNFNFGKNWVSPGWITNTSGVVTGTSNIISPVGNNPGFADINLNNLRLVAGSSAIGAAGVLAPEITSNYLGLNLSPIAQYVANQNSEVRASLNDIGAYEYSTGPATYSISNFTTLFSSWLHIGTVSDLNSDNIENTKDLGIMMNKWN